MSETENKREYEMAYLLAPDILEENIDSEITGLKKIISENGGEIIEFLTPKKRQLAYPIKKQNRAYFGVAYFNANGVELNKIKTAVALYKKMLRYLILNETLKPILAPIKLQDEQAPTQSFEKKLESILNR